MTLKPTFYNGVPYFGPGGVPAFGLECCPYDPECVWIELSSSISVSGEPDYDTLEPPLPADGGKIIFHGEALDTNDTPHGSEYYSILWVVAGCFPDVQALLDYQAEVLDWINDNGWADGEGNQGTVDCDETSVMAKADEVLETPIHPTPPDEVNYLVEYSMPDVICCPDEVVAS